MTQEKEFARAPHCDERILHAPGTCIFCDHYPDRQEARKTNGVNFTNTNNPSFKPCPAVAARGDMVNYWHGNVAYATETEFNETMERMFGGIDGIT